MWFSIFLNPGEVMSILTTAAISLVIVLHILFMVLEMFMWNTPFGRKIFGLKEDYAKQSAALAANQGLYNGFLAAGLLWGLISTGGFDALIFFLSCVIIAGVYGALTAKRSILFLQALPAAIAMALLILNN
jgi:putative membrane protein